ncbi:MAG TPA: HD-GYP domain-containing protein [Miltoncostaeaceae bacterium]|nr:HD-GYP domain-containing protein [Miltoncostaeaceae bacterium]
MRVVAVDRLTPGMRLGRAVFSHVEGHRHPLLAEGMAIGPGMPAALKRAGVGAVYIDDDLSEGIAPLALLPPEVREEAIGEVTRVFDHGLCDRQTVRVGSQQLERIQSTVTNVLAAIRASGGIASSLAGLQSFDQYTLEHSVNVMTLGLAVGDVVMRTDGWSDWRGTQRRDSRDERLTALGVGLLLHDIGKMAVPADILNKPGRLTDEEMAIMREHPTVGVQMVDGESLSALSRSVILSHHERHDGSGYPAGLRGDAIHLHARVAGIVDVYDAMSSTRVYSAARPAHIAWEMVIGMAGQGFALPIVRAFAEAIVPYAEGLTVQLSDGSQAIVARNSPGRGSRPVVRVITDPLGRRITPHEIDLADHADLAIETGVGDVGDPVVADEQAASS